MQAREMLDDWEYSSKLSMGDLHRLMLLAGYSEEAARQVASQRGWDRLCAGVEM